MPETRYRVLDKHHQAIMPTPTAQDGYNCGINQRPGQENQQKPRYSLKIMLLIIKRALRIQEYRTRNHTENRHRNSQRARNRTKPKVIPRIHVGQGIRPKRGPHTYMNPDNQYWRESPQIIQKYHAWPFARVFPTARPF